MTTSTSSPTTTTPVFHIDEIAQVCHEANRAYCATQGDNSQPTWENAPDWQKGSAMEGVRFHLSELEAGRTPSPAASHEKWLEQKRAEGWTYGPVKNPELKQHPCFVPYDQLPTSQRVKDYIFGSIVAAFYLATTAEACATTA